jgi:hypothetical protein
VTVCAAVQGLPQSFSFLNDLFRSKPPASLKDLSPQELQIEAARRETVEIKAQEDLDTLREHAVNLVFAREVLKAKNNELKQMLTDSQVCSCHILLCNDVVYLSLFTCDCCSHTEHIHGMQTQAHSDETITQELVQAKLDLADAAYERLKLQSAYDRMVDKNRILARKLTQAAVDRDLLAHRLAKANEMDQ